jgi:LmbE family N-acetylglucosaminyl deacetylase
VDVTQQWQQHPGWGQGPVLDPTSVADSGTAWRRLVVVSAHPDDESLGIGGLIHLAHRAGIPVYLVLLTAGEASHPPREDMSRHAVATQRLAEMDAAVELLAPGAPVVFLGAPDRAVAEVEDPVAAALREILGDGAGTVVLAPWRHDGHPDHEAAGRAAARAAADAGAMLVEYPLLAWTHRRPEDLPWEQVQVVRLDEATLETKLAAIRAHRSQVRTAGSSRPALDARLLAHCSMPLEHVVVAPAVVLAGIEAASAEQQPTVEESAAQVV